MQQQQRRDRWRSAWQARQPGHAAGPTPTLLRGLLYRMPDRMDKAAASPGAKPLIHGRANQRLQSRGKDMSQDHTGKEMEFIHVRRVWMPQMLSYAPVHSSAGAGALLPSASPHHTCMRRCTRAPATDTPYRHTSDQQWAGFYSGTCVLAAVTRFLNGKRRHTAQRRRQPTHSRSAHCCSALTARAAAKSGLHPGGRHGCGHSTRALTPLTPYRAGASRAAATSPGWGRRGCPC